MFVSVCVPFLACCRVRAEQTLVAQSIQHSSSDAKQFSLYSVQIQAGCRSPWSKGIFVSLFLTKPQPTQWDISSLWQLNHRRSLEKPRVGLLSLGFGGGGLYQCSAFPLPSLCPGTPHPPATLPMPSGTCLVSADCWCSNCSISPLAPLIP